MNKSLHPISELSFPDEDVTSWQISDDTLVVCLTGAHCGQHHRVPVQLVVKGWTTSAFRMYDGSWQAVGDELDPLKDICECVFEEEKVCLRGFGQRLGLWVEYEFFGATAEATTL